MNTFIEALDYLANHDSRFALNMDSQNPDTFYWAKTATGNLIGGMIIKDATQDDLDEIAQMLGWCYTLRVDKSESGVFGFRYFCQYMAGNNTIWNELEFYPTKIETSRKALEAIIYKVYPKEMTSQSEMSKEGN